MTQQVREKLDSWFTQGKLLRVEAHWTASPGVPGERLAENTLEIWTRGRVIRREGEDESDEVITLVLEGGETLRFSVRGIDCFLQIVPPPHTQDSDVCLLRVGGPGSYAEPPAAYAILTETA